MAILNPNAPATLASGDAACFHGDPRRLLLTGPLTLYRLAGSKTARGHWAHDQERGAWWFDSDLLRALSDDLLTAEYDGNRETRRHVLAGTRTDLAVLQKWSDMAWFCILKLGAADSVRAWVGPAQQQQDRGHGFFEGLLPGGGTQYFIPDLGAGSSANATKQPTHAVMAKMRHSPGWRG